MRQRILLFSATLVLVPLLTYFVILIARGYRFTRGQPRLAWQPTGILAATSQPEGAEVYINGQFKSATNTNLNLTPGIYRVEIKKETYYPWKKTLEIKTEEVTRAWALLLPTVPTLKAVTTAGASLPTLSPDGSKVAFIQPNSNRRLSSLYLLDLTDSPLGILNRDPRRLGSLPTISTLVWSPDSKQLLLVSSPAAYLTDVNNPNQQFASVSANVNTLLEEWHQLLQARERQKFSTLPSQLQSILATSAAELIWSPKENKLLYTATTSATIPDNLIRPLPGSSTQTQSRDLRAGGTYAYDLEEDRNFAIGTSNLEFSVSSPTGLAWFPTSSHLLKVEQESVALLEYDGGNPTVVYQGPMESRFAGPYPSGKQLLILTNLTPTTSQVSNLYAVSLR